MSKPPPHRVRTLEEIDAENAALLEVAEDAVQFELFPPVKLRAFTCQHTQQVRTSMCSGLCTCPEERPYHGVLPPKRKIAPPDPPRDNVNLPKHYARYKIEPIHFLMENDVDPFQFNIIKYAMRWEQKNGVEDLKKMLRYGEMYLKKVMGCQDWWKPTTMSIPGYYP